MHSFSSSSSSISASTSLLTSLMLHFSLSVSLPKNTENKRNQKIKTIKINKQPDKYENMKTKQKAHTQSTESVLCFPTTGHGVALGGD